MSKLGNIVHLPISTVYISKIICHGNSLGKVFEQTDNQRMSCYVIAELGTSHGGDLSRAEDLIYQAAEAGAHAAKFQIVLAREIIHPLTGDVPLPGGSISLYRRFQELEQTKDFYFQLQDICRRASIEFLATPFGLTSASWLKEMDVPHVKLASPELNHFPLLKEICSWKKSIFLSTGVSKLQDIEEALEIIGSGQATILHCVTAYPAPPQEYNLAVLPLLHQIFQRPVGISDHSEDPLMVPLTAFYQGASVLEKHIRLKDSIDGLDDPFALIPDQFQRMCKSLGAFQSLDREEQFQELCDLFSERVLKEILGHGIKKLAPSEEANYRRTNRSIHAMEDLSKGTILTRENCVLLRTEKILRPGLHPRFYPLVLGKRLSRSIDSGQGITWDDLLIPAEGNPPVD